MEVDAFFTTEALNKRRMAFRARIEHVEGSLNKKLMSISHEHVTMLSKLGGCGTLDGVMQEISASALAQAVSEAFAALSAFTPDVDPAEAWDREPMLKRLAMLREQVRMLKEELRHQQTAYNELAVSHSALLNFNNAIKATLWATLSAVVVELRNRGEEGGVQSVLQAFREEWPSNGHTQQSLLDHLQRLNERGAVVMQYSEDADDAVKELVANAVAEARAEERVNTKAIEEQLRDYERSLPTRISEAVRAAQHSSQSNAALFERLKSEYEQHIDELNDLIETMKGEASRRVDETRAVVMHFSKANVGDIQQRSLGPASSSLADRSAAEALLKQEELKLELLRQKMDNKLEQQALHRTLKAANQRLANLKPESVIIAEAQAPLIQEVHALKQQVLLLSDKVSLVVKDSQRSKELFDSRSEGYVQAIARLERTNDMLRRENESYGQAFSDRSSISRVESTSGENGNPVGHRTDSPRLQPRVRLATVVAPTDVSAPHPLPSPGQDMMTRPQQDDQRDDWTLDESERTAALSSTIQDACTVAQSGTIATCAGLAENSLSSRLTGDHGESVLRSDSPPGPCNSVLSLPTSQSRSGSLAASRSENQLSSLVDVSLGPNNTSPSTTAAGGTHAPSNTIASRNHSESRDRPLAPRPLRKASKKEKACMSGRGSATVDAMVNAALAASRVPAVDIAYQGLFIGKKKQANASSLVHDAAATADSMKPMALVKVLLQAAALSAMLSATPSTPVLAPHAAQSQVRQSKDAGTQTRVVHPHPPASTNDVDKYSDAPPRTPLGVARHDGTNVPDPHRVLPQRPMSGRIATRSTPTVQAVHKRSVHELSLLPQRMLLAQH